MTSNNKNIADIESPTLELEILGPEILKTAMSIDSSVLEDPAYIMNNVVNNKLFHTSVCMPAVVKEYDREKNIVTVQPAISIPTTDGKFLERAPIKVPVMQPAGGGFVMSFPLAKGDTGWLMTCDVDISLFKGTKKPINPNTQRLHAREDSFFMPDYISGYQGDKSNSNNIIIKSIKGASEVIIAEDKVQIKIEKSKNKNNNNTSNATSESESKSSDNSNETTANENNNNNSTTTPTTIVVSLDKINKTAENTKEEYKKSEIAVSEELKFKCPKITIDGDVEIESKANITITAEKISFKGDVEIEGDLNVSGDTNIDGDLDVSGDISGSEVEGGEISLSSHVHPGVQSGSGTTGAPQ